MLKSQQEVAVLQKSRNATSRDLLDWGEACGVTVTRSRSTRLGLTRNLSCYVYVVFMLCLQLPFPVQSIKQVSVVKTLHINHSMIYHFIIFTGLTNLDLYPLPGNDEL